MNNARLYYFWWSPAMDRAIRLFATREWPYYPHSLSNGLPYCLLTSTREHGCGWNDMELVSVRTHYEGVAS